MNFKEMIDARIPVIYDGAMGTEIQKHNITEDDFEGKSGCNEIINVTRSEVIQSIHLNYLSVGANVIETNTFGGNRVKLAEYGVEHRLKEINGEAVKAARNAIEEFGGDKPVFVCGAMGPTGNLLSSTDPLMNKLTFGECRDIFAEQGEALVEAGADILLLETMQDLLEVRAAITGLREMFKKIGKEVPIQVQVTMDSTGHMLF
jgi:5-methyltetrahydrofolate--homocysteine methyltransferase